MGLLLNCWGEIKFEIVTGLGPNIAKYEQWKDLISTLVSNDLSRYLRTFDNFFCFFGGSICCFLNVEKNIRWRLKKKKKSLALTTRHPFLSASQHFVNILTGGKKKKKNRNCWWMLSGLCIFLRIKRKETGRFVFWKLANMPGQNNSPDDACLASARLILPPTHSAPRHLNHLYLFLCPAFPPLPYFPLSRSDWLPAWPIFLIHVCTYTWIPVGEEGENWRLKSLSSFLGAFPAPPLSWLVKVVWIMSYFILGYWYAAGRRRRSIN